LFVLWGGGGRGLPPPPTPPTTLNRVSPKFINRVGGLYRVTLPDSQSWLDLVGIYSEYWLTKLCGIFNDPSS
jgi:hypothetical protein